MGTRLTVVVVLAALLSASACSQQSDGAGQPEPQRAGEPLDPAARVARIAALQVAAVAGDRQAVRGQMDAFSEDMRRSMKVADPSRPIDREAARTAAKRVQGVRSVAWVDRTNLLALVTRNELRSYRTIDDICLQLEPLGDTLAVVVHLQSAAARTGDELETISRNCQLAPGDRGLFQDKRQLDVLSPDVRRTHQAANASAPDAAESQRRANEAMRVLEATTPEM